MESFSNENNDAVRKFTRELELLNGFGDYKRAEYIDEEERMVKVKKGQCPSRGMFLYYLEETMPVEEWARKKRQYKESQGLTKSDVDGRYQG